MFPIKVPLKNPITAKVGSRMYSNREKTGDIKFKIGSECISAHKCVLASLSPKYEAQFYGEFDDTNSEFIEVKGVSASAFKEFLQFFYCDEINLTRENIEEVLFLTKESLVDEFFKICINFLSGTYSIENVCQTFHLSTLYECEDLLKRCKLSIVSNSDQVFASNAFITCDREILTTILQMGSLASKETDIFKACITWAKNKCNESGKDPTNNENLRNELGDLIYQIRFGAMRIEEFMPLYKTFKDLFTEDEREEIFYSIGKVNGDEVKKFNSNPR